MSAERDELAEVIASVFGFEVNVEDGMFADAILAAGYSKPRTVTTGEALDALPVGSVVRSFVGGIYEKDCYGDDPEIPWWCETADSRQYPSRRVSLPVTVLYIPQDAA